MYVADMTTQIQTLGDQLQTDLIAWGTAAIAIVLAAAAVLWVMRLLGR